jgi:hypothetical protein
MFVAVYWWRVHPGKEEQFRAAWRRGTGHITRIYGSFGSRLHRERDGRFVAYAEWPDEAAWQRAYDAKMAYDDPETRAAFGDSFIVWVDRIKEGRFEDTNRLFVPPERYYVHVTGKGTPEMRAEQRFGGGRSICSGNRRSTRLTKPPLSRRCATTSLSVDGRVV